MTTITINIPDDRFVGTKVAGETIPVDVSKVDNSWLVQFFLKGVQREINDRNGGEESHIKLDLAKTLVDAINAGDVKPERATGGGGRTPSDPVLALAMGNARAALTAMFKALTSKAKIADMVEADERVAAYFTQSESGKYTWCNASVVKWMDGQAAKGKTDYRAEAKAALAVDVSDFDI